MEEESRNTACWSSDSFRRNASCSPVTNLYDVDSDCQGWCTRAAHRPSVRASLCLQDAASHQVWRRVQGEYTGHLFSCHRLSCGALQLNGRTPVSIEGLGSNLLSLRSFQGHFRFCPSRLNCLNECRAGLHWWKCV